MIQDVQNQESMDEIPLANRTRRHNLLNIQQSGTKSIQQSFKTSHDLSTLPERLPSASKECRICLQPQSTDDNKLIAPCRCIGSVKYVHDGCYRKWIERLYQTKDKREQNKLLSEGIECEMCKQKIVLTFTTKRSCKSCETFRQKVRNNCFLFVLFLIFLILNSASLGYLVIYTAMNSRELGNNIVSLILVISSLLFLCVTLGITAYYFITDYIIDKVWRLQSFTMKARKKPVAAASSRYQIHPMSVQQLAE